MIRPISPSEFNKIDKVIGRLSRIDTKEWEAIHNLQEGEAIAIPHSDKFPCTKKGNCPLTTLVYNVARVTGGRYRTSHIGPRDVANVGCDHKQKGQRAGVSIMGEGGHKPEECGTLAVIRDKE